MSDQDEQSTLRETIRGIRREARGEATSRTELSSYAPPEPDAKPLDALKPREPSGAPLAPPERDRLNSLWRVSDPAGADDRSVLSKLLSPLQRLLHRLTDTPTVARQEEFNSAAVQFDNEILSYIDARFDRIESHYDDVLGKHGTRMEEIDERHLILQQELIRHVHDLVERIEFVFESAEQHHLYLEGMLREMREELDEVKTLLAQPDEPASQD